MSERFFCYRYDGSPIAHRPPLTEEKMLGIINSLGVNKEKYEIFELKRVKLKTVETLV